MLHHLLLDILHPLTLLLLITPAKATQVFIGIVQLPLGVVLAILPVVKPVAGFGNVVKNLEVPLHLPTPRQLTLQLPTHLLLTLQLVPLQLAILRPVTHRLAILRPVTHQLAILRPVTHRLVILLLDTHLPRIHHLHILRVRIHHLRTRRVHIHHLRTRRPPIHQAPTHPQQAVTPAKVTHVILESVFSSYLHGDDALPVGVIAAKTVVTRCIGVAIKTSNHLVRGVKPHYFHYMVQK